VAPAADPLFEPLVLPCGIVLKNRIGKAAMSDSLGDGAGRPTSAQGRLYERWAECGLALSIIGEVQGDPFAAEKPGNLVLNGESDLEAFAALARRGGDHGAQIWPQLGHAGAMAHPPIGRARGPSALDLHGLRAEALSVEAIAALPGQFAETARLARRAGFGGVQVHAAHGFLLSQFLSPLFNRREDAYGGPIGNRMRLLLEVVHAVRAAVGSEIAVAVKLNVTDRLEGGLMPDESLEVIRALDTMGIDLIDLSGGTYFPGAVSASDSGGSGPYFVDFARRARRETSVPLMATGGFKTHAKARAAVASGAVDMVGLARALVVAPDLPSRWRAGLDPEPVFPRFTDPPEGGVTAWYTMRLTEIGEDRETDTPGALQDAIDRYEARDADRVATWRNRFGAPD